MYGAEYSGGPNNKHDVPCAVCRSTEHISIVMIPARDSCYNGWTEQYRGMLMAGYHGHNSASQYICVDAQPEVVFRSKADQNGKILYHVQSKCGSLPCPPYIQDSLLVCVVCAK